MRSKNQRFEDRQTINQEMFGIYNAMRNGFDVINAAANKNAFDLYKYSRDNKDELMGQIGEMKTELAVLKATRPYQDALIQCDIRRVAEHADFNLWRRTCRMISGEVVLPNTPTVTGYASYNPCACATTTTTPTTAAQTNNRGAGSSNLSAPLNLNSYIMPFPQYQVNLGYDPLLAGVASPVDYITQLDNQIQQLTAAKSQIQSQLGNPNQNMQPTRPAQPQQAVQQISLWDEIDKEVCSLNNDQQAILAKDDVYNNVSAELQMLIQQELINSVRDKVANSPRGKELLEKQLNNIRAKKDSIIEEANKELELFKKFQIAAQANPKLTYVDFCNNIKNKEV